MNERKTSPASLQSSESAVAQAVNVSKYIAASSTLHPPQELQRGVSIASTLASPFNNLFAKLPDRLDREDRERLYERSRPVCAIDSFISRAWRSEGWSKWMALALHEVGLAPLVVGIVVSLLMGHLQRSVELPGNIRTRWTAESPSVLIASPWEYVAGLIAATASVFVWLAAQRQRSYFVDAACIHQTNRALKTQGIRHLAGFVAMSSQLVVLWDEHYFSRLWCVYELAMYRAIHPNRPVTFLPLRSAVFVIVATAAGAVGLFVILLVVMLLYHGDLTGSMHNPSGEIVVMGDDFWKSTMPMLAALLFVLFFLIYVGITLFGASMALQRIALQQHLESFDVRVAGCYSATDRDEICSAIGAIYVRRGTDGLDAFNHMVRTQLKEQVLQRVSGSTTLYSNLLSLSLPAFCLSGGVSAWFRETSTFTQVIYFMFACPFMLAWTPSSFVIGLQRGERLARSSNQPDLQSFVCRASVAIAFSAARGAAECAFFGYWPPMLLIGASEWPDAFPEAGPLGLVNVPAQARRASVLTLMSLWSIAGICLARRTFRPRAIIGAGSS